MFTTRTPESHHPEPTFALVLTACALLSSLIASESRPAAPFRAVLWTALIALAGYAAARLVSAAIGRPMNARTDLRLQIGSTLLLLAVALPAVVAAASHRQWIDAWLGAAFVAWGGVLILAMCRRFARA